MGVVVNAPTSNEIIRKIRDTIDIPVIVTVVSENENIRKRIEAGATILNVSGGKNTARIVRKIREEFPDFPIIATGGPTDENNKRNYRGRSKCYNLHTTIYWGCNERING